VRGALFSPDGEKTDRAAADGRGRFYTDVGSRIAGAAQGCGEVEAHWDGVLVGVE